MITQTSVGNTVPDPLPEQKQQQQYHPLKYQRLLRGWSQQDVAEELTRRCIAEGKRDAYLYTDTVSKWERSINKPSPLYRKQLCLLYGVTADKLGLM